MQVRVSKDSKNVIFCPKKNIRLAVRRNRIKRIMRECLRDTSKANWFIRVFKDPEHHETKYLRADWLNCLKFYKCI